MTTEPRFLALVAKVDEDLHELCETGMCDSNPIAQKYIRVTKVAIMAHEPMISVDGYLACSTCISPDSWYLRRQPFPCKPFLDIESEVGK